MIPLRLAARWFEIETAINPINTCGVKGVFTGRVLVTLYDFAFLASLWRI